MTNKEYYQQYIVYFGLVDGKLRMVKTLSCETCLIFIDKVCLGRNYKGRQCSICLKTKCNMNYEIRVCSEWWLYEDSEQYQSYLNLFKSGQRDLIPKKFLKVLAEQHINR